MRDLNPSFAANIGPIVLPQEESFRTTNLCNSVPARRAISSMTNIPGEFVAYRAFALICVNYEVTLYLENDALV
jgi:hypothetical protein